MKEEMTECVIVPWGTEESLVRLARSECKGDFQRLAMFYQAQDNKMFCGVAAGAIVLNALRVGVEGKEIPLDTTTVTCNETLHMPDDFNPHWNRYSQDMMLANAPKSRIEVLGKPYALSDFTENIYGLHMFEFADMMEAQGTKVDTVEVHDRNEYSALKQQMIDALDTQDRYVVAYFSRKSLGQQGSGHFSPIAAYDSASDSFLLMDTNNVSNHWSWIDAGRMIEAMNSYDGRENRGFAIISD